jgi:hypothetical protein
VPLTGEHVCRAEQIVGDGRALAPGRVGAEAVGRMGPWPVNQIGEHSLDDRVAAVDDISLVSGRSVSVRNGR